MKLIESQCRSVQSPVALLLCKVSLAHACQNLLQHQVLLRCQFVPVWSLTSYTVLHGNTSFHTYTRHTTHSFPTYPCKQQLSFLLWFIQYICRIFRAGRQMWYLSASRAHAKAACLGGVWLKSGLGNPLVEVITCSNANEAFAPVMALPNGNTNPHVLI